MATKFSAVKLFGFCGLLLLFAALGFPAQGFAQGPPKFVYVANISDNTVSAYSINATSGALIPVAGSPFAAGLNPVGVLVDPSGKFLYVANFISNNVSAYTIDATSGALTPVAGSPFAAGAGPVWVAVDPSGKFVYVTNGNSNNISAFTMDTTSGALTPVAGSPFAAGTEPHGAAVDASGKFVYVANFSSNNVSAYTMDATTGALTPVAGSPFAAGSNPDFVAVDPYSKFLYVTNFNSANVFAYAIDNTSGALTPVVGSPFATGNNPRGVAVDSSARFVYVANEGSASASAFTIDATSGALTPVAGSPFAAGTNPVGAAVDPSGKFVYVTNQNSNDVSAYSIDSTSGALTPVPGSPFAAGRFCFGVAVTSACVPAPAGLVSWWPGEGDARDVAGNNDGTLISGATFASGKVGDAFSFDGSNGGVVIPDSPSFDMTDFTLDAWIKTTDAGSGRRRIISQQLSSPNTYWAMTLFDNQLEVCSSPDIGCVAFTGQTLNDGHFHHVAITRKSGSQMKWYIDGVNVKTQAISTGSFAIPADVYIGKLDPLVAAHFGVNESFNGIIDEPTVFNRALTSSEIQSIVNAGPKGKCPCTPPPSGMVSWWPGEGNVNDIVGGNNGTLQNGAGFGSGEVGQAFSMNGAAQWVDLGGNVGSFGADDFTIDYWILWHSFDGEEVMIEKFDNGPQFGGAALQGWTFTKVGTPVPAFQFGGAAGGNYTSVDVALPGLSTETWHHVAVTRSSGFVKMYLDSTVVATGTIPSIDPTPNPLTLGRRSDARGNFQNGLIDEVEIFHRALSGDEIAAIFNAGGAGKCKPKPTATSLASSLNPSTFGDTVTFTATVTASSGTPTGTVTFSDGAATLGTSALDGNGQASFSTATLSGGSHSITAVHAGDASFAWSTSDVLTQTVVPAATTTTVTSDISLSTYGQTVTFTAAVTSAAGTPTGTVTFMDGVAVLGSAGLNGGQAVFSTSSLLAGSHSITAAYSGDGNFATSGSIAITQTVSAAATTTVVVSSANPSTFGQAVTLTATVTSGFALPVGTVTFRMGNTILATQVLNGSGQASFTTSALSGGSNPITAAYSGNPNFLASSGSVTQKVATAATATVLTSSLNPSNVGQTVSFTVTVTSGSGTPTGKVTFKDGTKNLGSTTLSGGQATLSTSALKRGSHTITAAYAGAANFGGSSASTVQTVQ